MWGGFENGIRRIKERPDKEEDVGVEVCGGDGKCRSCDGATQKE